MSAGPEFEGLESEGFQSAWKEHSRRTEDALTERLADAGQMPESLHGAMKYACLGGGKRFRAMLVYSAGEAFGAAPEQLDAVAASVELIHAYSLIHDDLPAMDDDDLGRGRLSCHKAFDEATAILAGDALLTLAFEIISSVNSNITDQQCRIITNKLSKCCGQVGMVGGQMLDIVATNSELSLPQLENIHRRKTGALIQASVFCGAVCSDSIKQTDLDELLSYASNLGLAYQVIDDVLDIESSTETLGKPNGSDQALNKSTYPSIIGLQSSKDLTENLYQKAIASAASIGDNSQSLVDLAALVIKRDH